MGGAILAEISLHFYKANCYTNIVDARKCNIYTYQPTETFSFICTLRLVLYCYLEYTLHKHLVRTQNILVEQFNLIMLRLKSLLIRVVQISAAFILQNVA